MSAAPAPPPPPKPLSHLTKRDLAVLQATAKLRFITAKDLAYLLGSPTSLTAIRHLVASLAGGTEHVGGHYLYRLVPPTTTRGNSERVYCLGSKGAEAITQLLGEPVYWYCLPSKLKGFSYSFLRHALLLTRVVTALTSCARTHPAYTVTDTRLCYELVRGSVPGLSEATAPALPLPVIPDAWVHLCVDGRSAPLWIEADCGTEMRHKFQAGLKARIAFLQSGYEEVFATPAVTILYLTTGHIEAYKDNRREAMQRWTQALLRELELQEWAESFRFASVTYDSLYTAPLFDAPVFYGPGEPNPVALLAPPNTEGDTP
jgi:hypothetical protein